MFKIQSSNPNYLAKIVKLGPPRKHSNADKLICHNVLFNNIITDSSYKEGDIVVYFPLESAINKDFVAFFNGFSKEELNKDKVKGYFNNQARVRAVKLRGEPSMGFIIKMEILLKWLESKKVFVNADNIVVDTDFDSIGDILICEKYVVPSRGISTPKDPKRKVKRESKIVEGQFAVHEDTDALKRNIHKLELSDIISISYKMHGSNGSFGKVLCKRPLNRIEKFLKWCGIKIDDTQYDLVYASRRIIKNAYADKVSASYYDTDIWAMIAERIKDKIEDGITLYGEIVGQMPNGKWVQKDYDYGLAPNIIDFFVFRITLTLPTGKTYEFTAKQVERYCKKYELNMVPLFYYGTIVNYFTNNNYIVDESSWGEDLLDSLIKKYTEKNCYLCKNKLPEEGIVLIKERTDCFEGYKLKSFNFLERETKLLDTGEENMEDDTTEL